VKLPPVVMSWKAPPLMLISSTMPSKVDSVAKLFLNVNWVAPAGRAMTGETSSVRPTVDGSGAKASFGALTGVVVEVTHGDSEPLAVVVHPAGSAGADTPSKF
jgi:hypothetical protein